MCGTPFFIASQPAGRCVIRSGADSPSRILAIQNQLEGYSRWAQTVHTKYAQQHPTHKHKKWPHSVCARAHAQRPETLNKTLFGVEQRATACFNEWHYVRQQKGESFWILLWHTFSLAHIDVWTDSKATAPTHQRRLERGTYVTMSGVMSFGFECNGLQNEKRGALIELHALPVHIWDCVLCVRVELNVAPTVIV